METAATQNSSLPVRCWLRTASWTWFPHKRRRGLMGETLTYLLGICLAVRSLCADAEMQLGSVGKGCILKPLSKRVHPNALQLQERTVHTHARSAKIKASKASQWLLRRFPSMRSSSRPPRLVFIGFWAPKGSRPSLLPPYVARVAFETAGPRRGPGLWRRQRPSWTV